MPRQMLRVLSCFIPQGSHLPLLKAFQWGIVKHFASGGIKNKAGQIWNVDSLKRRTFNFDLSNFLSLNVSWLLRDWLKKWDCPKFHY